MKQIVLNKQITLRENISTKKYLQEVSQIQQPLTSKEEKELCKKIKQGDKKAEEELITRNLRFVISVAKQYQQSGASLEDLISEGNYGLVKAARRYNADTGNKFISYAVWWIQQSILMYLGEKIRLIRIPPNKINDLIKIQRITDKLEQKLEREPTPEEIFQYSSKTKKPIKNSKITFLLSSSQKPTSLEQTIKSNNNDKENSTVLDILKQNLFQSPDDKLLKEDIKIELYQMLKKIPVRNRIILEHYYGLNNQTPKNLEEISQIVGLTSERVRQIKNSSIRTLKRIANSLPSHKKEYV